MNNCASFIAAIKQQTNDINTLPCSTILSRINSGTYGMPSSACVMRCNCWSTVDTIAADC